MLVSILLSIFWALCSTVLVLPWFWKSLIRRKTIVGNKEYRGIDEGKKNLRDFILYQIFAFGVTFFSSWTLYKDAGVTRTLIGAVVPFCLVCVFQVITMSIGWNNNVELKSRIIGVAAVLLIIVSAINSYTGYCLDVEGVEEESAEELPLTVTVDNIEQLVPSNDSIKYLFDVTSVEGPLYMGDKYVYITSSPDGIVILDKANGKVANFFKTDYDFLQLRNEYPFNIIRKAGIVVTDDNIPYKRYAVVAKKSIIAKPVLDKYVYQNMLTGEVTEASN